MSNSGLVRYTALSPNHSGTRNHAIDTITPHYVCGNCSVEALGSIFASMNRQASSNYSIGNDGRVALYVDEANRAWTSGSSSNDNRAVTIECANLDDGSLTNTVWNSLVELCADICRRNGKKRLIYRGSPNYAGLASDEMLLTMHKWFQDTDCPGPWLSKQFDRLANEVNAKLGGSNVINVDLGDVAASIHYDMVTDPRNGYSQDPRWGGDYGGTKTLSIYGRNYTYKLGSYDCASSVIIAWRLALQGTPYEGALDGATYTGDMEAAFVNSGLFTSKYSAAKRGDLYLRPKTSGKGGHVAMCQDGGSDGVFGYDCLSEFNRNENHAATGGKPGDQDDHESIVRDYYDGPWSTVLHYNGKANYEVSAKPVQKAGKPKNKLNFKYRGHVQDAGWMTTVRDGQTAGTTGQSKRLEAVRIKPPIGWELDVVAHIEDIGDKTYKGITNASVQTIGTTGKSKRLEALKVIVRKRPAKFNNYRVMIQAHVENEGWKAPVPDNKWAGTRGKSLRMEAVRMWLEEKK